VVIEGGIWGTGYSIQDGTVTAFMRSDCKCHIACVDVFCVGICMARVGTTILWWVLSHHVVVDLHVSVS